MRNLFRSYYEPTKDEFAELWAKATIVFDANVLLNLYAFAEPERERFISVLRSVEDRIWLPYQVGLEFQRNRIARITATRDRIEALQDTIAQAKRKIRAESEQIQLSKRNIGVGDVEKQILALETAHDALASAVSSAFEKLPSISMDDPIREQVSELLKGKIGPGPADDKELAELLSDLEVRYAAKRPPGFGDAAKKTKYFDNGLEYDSRAGDLILWRQLLRHVREKGVNWLLFVTGDKKDDWWEIEKGRTLGPRAELLQEFFGASKGGLFWMYTSDQFLQYAKEHLKANVTEADILRVKEVVEQSESSTVSGRSPSHLSHSQLRAEEFERGPTAERAVRKWLESQGKKVLRARAFPDFITRDGEGRDGYEVRVISSRRYWSLIQRLEVMSTKGMRAVEEGQFRRFFLVIVLADIPGQSEITVGDLKDIKRKLEHLADKFPKITISMGLLLGHSFQHLFDIVGLLS